MYLPVWEAKTYRVKDNPFTHSSYSQGDFSSNGSCSGSSHCTISGSYTSEFLSQKTTGSNSNPTNLTITSTGTLASLNISQSLNTITNSGTILGSIKDCFDDNGNLKEGRPCSVGNWYGQPIIYANVTTFDNTSSAVIGSTLKGLPVKYSGLKALNV